MPIDVETMRTAEFPVAARLLYLNHAGVSPIPASSASAGIRLLQQYRDEGAFHLRKWVESSDEARDRFARLIGAASDEIAIIKNTSEGISLIAAGFPWKEGDNLVTANVEFPANIYPWMRLEAHNIEVRMVRAREGRVRKDDLFAACDGKTRLIALSSVEFANGYRNDLAGIGEYCQKQGIFFFVDAIQSLGVVPMDVRAYGIDALAADGHKWMLSPEGIGGFYISRDVMEMVEPVVLGWHSVRNRFDFEQYDFHLSPDAKRFEPGSFNTVGLAAFGASLRLILSVGVERIWERVRRLTEEAIECALRSGYEVVTPRHPEERSGIVTFRVPGADPKLLWKALLSRNVVCAPRSGGIRISPHFYNTSEEIARFFQIVKEETGAQRAAGREGGENE
ncbi:MAG: aminotransferase class V-fold PLP-dependent enzyme [Deltaproteobacteria bacterium]|nr:MAG: aminotransferase class V-fold PLP-dependent enzyme [Deltaproteobacteria bacterium]